jgi:hypothetical protein
MAGKTEILQRADVDIDAFDKWFQEQGAQPLVRSERAIIKTFLVALRSGKLAPPAHEGTTEMPPCRLT